MDAGRGAGVTAIAFVYNFRHRVILDPKVRFTMARNLIITGTDADHGKTRTFRVDKIEGPIIHVIPRQCSQS